MYKGDISNAFTRRVLVTTDAVLTWESSIKKVFGIIPKVEKKYAFNSQILSRIYLWATRSEYTYELVTFDLNEKELDALIGSLEKIGTNPFRYATVYTSIDHLIAELPYRPDVVGVMDRPDRLLRYGSWGMDLV
jgi:predicted metal-dependent peptidase